MAVITAPADSLSTTQADAADTLHHRICPLCEACCGLELKVRAGKVISIRGHDADVFSAGYICPKGVALKELHEDPDRLRTPLIKRKGAFVDATWDEAFAEIERCAQSQFDPQVVEAFKEEFRGRAVHASA